MLGSYNLFARPIKFLPIVFLFFTALGFAKPSANLQTIDQLFSNAVSREMVPGISVAIADKDGVVLFQPGTDSKYSTFAFSLIAAAMEGADKKRSFKQIIQQEVFTPLDMQNSVFDDQADIIPLRQRPYVVRDGKLLNAPQSDHSYKYAGGGFIATPSDISRFAVAHTHETYLQKASLDAMFSRAKIDNGKTQAFGIGWMIDFDNHKDRSYYKNNASAQNLMANFDNVVMHSGGSNGGTTMLILCRDHQRSITVVKNVDGEHSADVFLLALEGLAMFHRNEI